MAFQLDALGRLPKTYRPRVNPFNEFTARKFKQRYRISKASAQEIVDHMQLTMPVQGQARGGGLSLQEKFCLGVRYIATGANFSPIGDVQGVSKATVSRSVEMVVNYFYRNSRRYIKWPQTHAQRMGKAAQFQATTGMPRCIGLMDGTHVSILGPNINPQAYINRHGYSSLNVMVIFDSDENITHINPAWHGSVGDGHAFNLSPIRRLGNNGVLNPFYLLADTAYPCTTNCFTPVRVEADAHDQAYNAWHRTHRSKVERCIGKLKMRFRALDAHGGFLYHTPQKAARLVIAAACLHNIAQGEGDGDDIEIDDDEDNPPPPAPVPAANVPNPNVPDNDPAARNAFINAHF